MKCSDNCGYYYQDEDDDFPCCHFQGPFNAPCEEDDFSDDDREEY